MQITIRPDPDCIELIRSEFKNYTIGFLETLGLKEDVAKNWESIHTIEINENDPPIFKFYPMMRCYLPEGLFKKSEWVFKYSKKEFFELFEISGHILHCLLRHSFGVEQLPKNISNLCCGAFPVKNLKCFNDLKYFDNLKSLSFTYCESLKDITLIKNLINLQSLDLSNCTSLVDISVLSKLVNLKSLDLSNCTSLVDISVLSKLVNLKSLDLSSCGSIKNIDNSQNKSWKWWQWKSITPKAGLSNLVNLHSLNLNYCTSITDISGLSNLVRLESLDLGYCKQITDISCLSNLVNLHSLNLDACESLTDVSVISQLINLRSLNCSLGGLSDISFLSKLINLRILRLFCLRSLKDISVLSNFVYLESLDLSYCTSISDISSLSKLVNLKKVDLSKCFSVSDVSSLSGLVNLEHLELRDCQGIASLNCLLKMSYIKYLNITNLTRIKDYSVLRNCIFIKHLYGYNLHPSEFIELICFLTVQRKDIPYISEFSNTWINELKMGLNEQHPIVNDLACVLAQAIILANLEEVGLSFHQTLLNHPNVGLAPWKIWFSENLKAFGWDKIQNLAELSKPSELTFGAIGGISSCLPSMDSAPVQIAWAKKWIYEIHFLHNNNSNFLKPAAAEWCLALKRLMEDELLIDWIEKFTDSSNPSALDPINKVFSAYALDLNDSESALEYALKINDPKLRDESILNLAQQFIKEGETSKAGEFLFLLTQVESKTQLAYSLAEDAAYLKSDENAHRLLAACGDSPQSLASILDKLRLANPDSEILKIMHEKLSDEIRFSLSDEAIALEAVVVISKLSKVTDSTFLNEAKKAMETLLKNKPNYV